MKKIIELIMQLGEFRWIVTEENDIGFKFLLWLFVYYKWNDTVLIYWKNQIKWRELRKKELNKTSFIIEDNYVQKSKPNHCSAYWC